MIASARRPLLAATTTLPPFAARHIGPDGAAIARMLGALGYDTLEDLLAAAIPEAIRVDHGLNLPEPLTEAAGLATLRQIAQGNRVYRSLIGMGYADCVTPTVIQRNILENPGWYTAYTPYQAEIAQGRLEALLNFQTMILSLTGMEIANASLLDEGTAAAEAVAMSFGLCRNPSQTLWIAEGCHPQTIAVVQTRALPLGWEVVVGDPAAWTEDRSIFAMVLPYTASDGAIADYGDLVQRVQATGALVTVIADPLSLVLLEPPGHWGVDVVVGNSQRLGVPLGYGGPHAAFFATKEAYKRQMPGRIVGVSQDANGQPALRLALQTREQHIRREKATSNICTAQVLLAVIAGMYGLYHGPEGLKTIAQTVHGFARQLGMALRQAGLPLRHDHYFDTLTLDCDPAQQQAIRDRALARGFNLRYFPMGAVALTLDECTDGAEVQTLWEILTGQTTAIPGEAGGTAIPGDRQRRSPLLTEPIFQRYHSETEMLRYLHQLETKDLSLTGAMIPLGSCTMKLNATTEMIPISWPEFNRLHPYTPLDQTQGYQTLFAQLSAWLAEITGFAGISLQPNAGSQGEYAGLQVIRRYHQAQGQDQRDVCLIPESAHGTNPASAVMCGLQVVPVRCSEEGDIDLEDLAQKAIQYQDRLAALMVTYPSTHGVFEAGIREICDLVHRHGGQVYMDGANMNALVGLCRPGDFGADVCHLNLHKTFCIPHGGGGPGMGPIGVAAHLVPHLPDTSLATGAIAPEAVGMIAAAPWGSASILPISWMYIALMGTAGLTQATAIAILNANYIAQRLAPHYPILFRGNRGLVAHECIIDLRPLKKAAGIEVDDIAKRLMDYGFHAPTVSWPVAGTMMIEPTESESLAELDRFCDAMIAIRAEVAAIEGGGDPLNNPLKQAPHPAAVLLAADWDRPYSREQAAYPLPYLKQHKYWVPVGRINNAYGDRHLVCSCVGMEAYQTEA